MIRRYGMAKWEPDAPIIGTTYPARSMLIRSALPADRTDVNELLLRRRVADGREALSEHKMLRLSRSPHELVAFSGGDLVGYAHAAWHRQNTREDAGHWAVEVVIDPALDGGDDLCAGLLGELDLRTPADQSMTFWAWRTDEVRHALGEGWEQTRALHEMCRPLPIKRPATFPDGIEVQVFRPGIDEDVWLAANNAAFAGHPENGALDRDNLETRMQQPWFDPSGFLLAWSGEELAGYCWTKLHRHGVGEIYIIGVVPTAQGLGLGTSLVVAGLKDLGERQGATEAVLYVAEEDPRAVAVYRKLGFEVFFTNREFVMR